MNPITIRSLHPFIATVLWGLVDQIEWEKGKMCWWKCSTCPFALYPRKRKRQWEMATMTAETLPVVASLCLASLHDRVVGTLFGSALGDAIGLYTEFLTSAQAEREYP